MSTTLVHIVTVPISLRTFFDGQISYMKGSGFDVQAISSSGTLLKEFGETEEIAVHRVNMPRKISPLSDCLAIFSLCRTLWRVRADIVHAHTPKAGLLGMIAGWLTRVPVRIYHIRGLPFVTMSSPRRWLLEFSERVACRLAHKVLCVSHSVSDVAIEKKLCSPEKISVLCAGSGNGVDAECRFNPSRVGEAASARVRESMGIATEATTLGFVGRFARDKGFVELAEAWGSLRAEYSNLHLLVIGSFDSRDPVPETLASKLRNDSRVHFIKQTQEIEAYYSSIDICALPTYREGLPNVLLEAAAMECPVVSTRVPGCVDVVVDGETGLLVPARDAGALHTAIRRYLQSKEMRIQHGKSARRWVLSKFRQEMIWSALRNEYLDLASRQGLEIPVSHDPSNEQKYRYAA